MKRFTRLLALSTCLFAPTTALFAETPPAPEVALARGLLMSHQGRLFCFTGFGFPFVPNNVPNDFAR